MGYGGEKGGGLYSTENRKPTQRIPKGPDMTYIHCVLCCFTIGENLGEISAIAALTQYDSAPTGTHP